MASAARLAPTLAEMVQDGAIVLFGRAPLPRGIHQPAFVDGEIAFRLPKRANGKHLSVPLVLF